MYYYSRQSVCLTTRALVVHYFIESVSGEKTIVPLTHTGNLITLTSEEYREIETLEPKQYQETNLTPSDIWPAVELDDTDWAMTIQGLN